MKTYSKEELLNAFRKAKQRKVEWEKRMDTKLAELEMKIALKN
ncbi:MAG: 30S ribosomal protein S7 [Prevotella sp.]|nr:30S ribosomal protein S7 [Prevotella sp.]